MNSVTVYLKHPLFSLRGEQDPMPNGAVVIKGNLLEEPKGGLRLKAKQYFSVEKSPIGASEELKELDGPSFDLFLPASKIDHMRFDTALSSDDSES